MNNINYNSYILFNRLLEETTKNNHQNILTKISIYGMDCTMIIAPLLTYCFQIIKFYRTKSSKGFSKYICLLLFLANILRIFFWYGIRFKNVLLYQSIGVSLFQIILIHLCIKFQEPKKNLPELKNVNENSNILENKNKINIVKNFIFAYFSKTFKPKYFKWLYCSKICNPVLFWNWTEEKEYYKFMSLITLLLIFISSSLNNFKPLFQLIGVMSALFETFICVPQAVSNCRTKFTKNISFMMIFCWLMGDSFRLFYNIKYNAPLQLIIGILFQIIINSIVLIQLILYRNNNVKEKERTNPNKKQIEEINQLMKSIDELNIGK